MLSRTRIINSIFEIFEIKNDNTIHVIMETLFQLYKALFSVGLSTAFSKKYGYGLFYHMYLMVAVVKPRHPVDIETFLR